MTFKEPRALTNDFGIITLAGDLGGTAATPSVLKVNGVSYPTSPGTNTVPVVTSSNTITYQQIADAQISSTAAIAVSKLASGSANQVLINNATPTPAWTTLTGDVTNVVGAMSVISLTGSSSNINFPAGSAVGSNEVITFNVTSSGSGKVKTVDTSGANSAALTITTGTTTTSGNSGALNLTSGAAAGTVGNVLLQTGGTTRLTISPTNITVAAFGTAGVVHNDSSGNLSSSLIVDADVASSAAIAVSKLAAGSTTQVLITNGTTPTWTTLSSDVTNNATGVTTVNSISGSSPVNITTASTFQWSSGVSTPSFTQAAPASASTGTAATNMSYSAQTGGAATSTTGGVGGNLTVSSGAGGAGTASNAGGGAAGALNLKGGAGGNATGSGTTGNGGNVVLTPGAAGTGGAGGGTAGNVNIQTSGASTIIQVTSAGAANLTASAASQFTTSSGALTITGAAASTWSLSANGSAGGAGFALTVASGAGGAGATSTAGGNAGTAELLGGTGGAGGTTGVGGTGGVSEVVGGTGGAGGSASGGNAGAGGQAELLGGTGGNATVTGTTAGTGGNITVDAGAAGTASGGASAGTNGSISIGTTNATSISVSRTGQTTTVNGALTVTQATTLNNSLTQSGGAVSITGNAASSFTTTSSALTLDAATALNLGNTNATSVVIGNTANTTAITINGTTSSTISLTPPTVQWTSGVTTPSITQIAPASASTGTAATNMSLTAQFGGAATVNGGGLGGNITVSSGTGGATSGTSQTAGAGGATSITGGTGGAGTAGNSKGGAGGAMTVSAGSGGSSNGTSANSNGANLTLTSGAAGTGGSGAAGTAGNVQLQIAGTTNITWVSGLEQWAAGISAPTIKQLDNASTSGQAFTVQAQNAGGSNNTGGNLVLTGGTKTGSGFDGYVFLEAGGNVEAFVNSSLINFSAGGLGIGTTPGTDPIISKGTGSPSTTQPNGSVFMRTDGSSGSTGVYTRQGGTWFAVGGGGSGTLTAPITGTRRTNSANATYTIDSTGGGSDFIIVHNKSGAVTYVLPSPTDGRLLTIKDITGALETTANNIFIAPNAVEKIDNSSGTASFAITTLTNGSASVTTTSSEAGVVAAGCSIKFINNGVADAVSYIVSTFNGTTGITLTTTYAGTVASPVTAVVNSLTYATNYGALRLTYDSTDSTWLII